MVEAIVGQINQEDRAQRGRDLYLSKRQLIVRVGRDAYSGPGNEKGSYIVRYGGEVEDCTCTDFNVHMGDLACKHLIAVALMYAKRRKEGE